MSPVDERAQELWDVYTSYKERMFEETDTSANPWVIIQGNRKPRARVKAIKHILKTIPYEKV
jgi:polyphosphate kinase 2 (PPK2 family)